MFFARLAKWQLSAKSGLEFARRHAHRSLEGGDKMRRSSEANVLCYLGNGLVRCLQERKSALQPTENDVPMRRHSCLLAERPDEVVDAQTRGTRQLFQSGRGHRIFQRGFDQLIDTISSRTGKAAACAPAGSLVATI
jgi:hypothetical protein